MSEPRVWGPISNGKYYQMKWRVHVDGRNVIFTRSLGSKASQTRAKARSKVIAFEGQLRREGAAGLESNITLRKLIELRTGVDWFTRKPLPDAKPRNYSSDTLKNERQAMASLVDFFGLDCKVNSLTATRAEEWEAAVSRRPGRHDEHVSEFTVRKYNGIVKRFFAWAKRSKKISHNPFEELASSALEVDKEVPYMPVDTFEKVAAVARPKLRTMLRLCRYGGLRLNECFPDRLPWTAIDFERRLINLLGKERKKAKDRKARRSTKKTTKSGARTLPIKAELLADLEAAFAAAPEGSRGPCDGLSYGNAYRNTTAAFARAKVECTGDPHHSLRASAERDWLASGFEETQVFKWMGHSPAVAQKHYIRPDEQAMRQAAGLEPPEVDRLRSELAKALTAMQGLRREISELRNTQSSTQPKRDLQKHPEN